MKYSQVKQVKKLLRVETKSLVTAFGAMRMIVTVGWAIYPLGYMYLVT